MNDVIEFLVIGPIQAKQRPRVTQRGITYTPNKTRNWEQLVSINAMRHKPNKLWECPIKARLEFFFPKPKSISKKFTAHIKKPDVDNICKSIFDAMEKIIFKGDQQIVECTIKKSYIETRAANSFVYIRLVRCDQQDFIVFSLDWINNRFYKLI